MSKYWKRDNCYDSSEIIVKKGEWKVCDDSSDYHHGHYHEHCHKKDNDCKKVLICKEEDNKHDHDHDDHCHKEKKCKKIILRVKNIVFYDDCPIDDDSCVPEVDVGLSLADAVFPAPPPPITAFPFTYRFDLPTRNTESRCRTAVTEVDFLIDILGVTYNATTPGGTATVTIEVLSGTNVIFREQRTLTAGLIEPPVTDFNLAFTRKVDLLRPLTIRGLVSAPTGGTVTVEGTASIDLLVHGTGGNNNNRHRRRCGRRIYC